MMQPMSCPTVNPALLRGRRLVVVGDVHLHVGSAHALASDLARLVRDSTQRDPCSAIIFNGDAFDLDRVKGQADCGIGHDAAARRLVAILDTFPELTFALTNHVSAQGVIVFVGGNHDAELLVADVQRVLLQRLQPADVGAPAPIRVACVERLSLPHVRIEHGHQTDPDSTFFPDMLSAVSKQRLSALPLASLFTRFFLSDCPRYEALGDNYRAPLPVLLRVLRDYRFASLAMIARYPFAAVRIAWQSVLGRVRRDVPAPTPSVSMSSPLFVIRRLYLDRYFGVLTALPLLAGILAGVLGRGAWWGVLAIAVYLAIPPSRRKSFDHRDTRGCESEASARSAEGAQLVVFGHLHRAFVTRIGDAIYANHGAFCLPVDIDPHGRICTSAQNRSPGAGSSFRARPYLSITTEPVECDLLVLI
jgi:UDP-2,3-diacylglucosamine pyrophosphatase LpxH